jgi:hypothetical protein
MRSKPFAQTRDPARSASIEHLGPHSYRVGERVYRKREYAERAHRRNRLRKARDLEGHPQPSLDRHRDPRRQSAALGGLEMRSSPFRQSPGFIIRAPYPLPKKRERVKSGIPRAPKRIWLRHP